LPIQYAPLGHFNYLYQTSLVQKGVEISLSSTFIRFVLDIYKDVEDGAE